MNVRLRRLRNNSVQESYSTEELEFLKAIDRYKRENNRLNPSWREVLRIVHALGYRKISHGTRLDCSDSAPLSDSVLSTLRLDPPESTPPPKRAGYGEPPREVEDGGGRSPESLRRPPSKDGSAPGEEDCGERG